MSLRSNKKHKHHPHSLSSHFHRTSRRSWEILDVDGYICGYADYVIVGDTTARKRVRTEDTGEPVLRDQIYISLELEDEDEPMYFSTEEGLFDWLDENGFDYRLAEE